MLLGYKWFVISLLLCFAIAEQRPLLSTSTFQLRFVTISGQSLVQLYPSHPAVFFYWSTSPSGFVNSQADMSHPVPFQFGSLFPYQQSCMVSSTASYFSFLSTPIYYALLLFGLSALWLIWWTSRFSIVVRPAGSGLKISIVDGQSTCTFNF